MGVAGMSTEMPGLSKYIPDHVAKDIRQAEVPPLEAEVKPFVIDTHQVQHGGVDIMDWNRLFNGVVTELIRVTVTDTTLDATAGHPHGKSLHVVVTAAALGHGCAAKLGSKNNKGFIQHSSLAQILDECRCASIHFPGRTHGMILHCPMVIPIPGVKLDKSPASLGQPSGRQAVAGKRAMAGVGTV